MMAYGSVRVRGERGLETVVFDAVNRTVHSVGSMLDGKPPHGWTVTGRANLSGHVTLGLGPGSTARIAAAQTTLESFTARRFTTLGQPRGADVLLHVGSLVGKNSLGVDAFRVASRGGAPNGLWLAGSYGA